MKTFRTGDGSKVQPMSAGGPNWTVACLSPRRLAMRCIGCWDAGLALAFYRVTEVAMCHDSIPLVDLDLNHWYMSTALQWLSSVGMGLDGKKADACAGMS